MKKILKQFSQSCFFLTDMMWWNVMPTNTFDEELLTAWDRGSCFWQKSHSFELSDSMSAKFKPHAFSIFELAADLASWITLACDTSNPRREVAARQRHPSASSRAPPKAADDWQAHCVRPNLWVQNVSKSANWCAALSPQGTEGAALYASNYWQPTTS